MPRRPVRARPCAGRRHRQHPGDRPCPDDRPVHDAAGLAEAGAHDAARDHLGRREREAEYDDARIVVDEPVSAENPWGDSISVTRVPSVLITRQPPENVPSAIAVAQTILTQTGMPASGASLPPATSVSTTTPIVFCASFVPWASATIELEAIWLKRKPSSRSALARARQPVREHRRDERGEAADERRQHRRDHDLRRDPAPDHRVRADAGDHRADHTADECVRRRRRDAEEPGGDVPEDRADQARRR